MRAPRNTVRPKLRALLQGYAARGIPLPKNVAIAHAIDCSPYTVDEYLDAMQASGEVLLVRRRGNGIGRFVVALCDALRPELSE